MAWYLQSLDDYDAHRGTSDRGRVNAVCGISFEPLRVGGGVVRLRAELALVQLCPRCVAASAAGNGELEGGGGHGG